MKALRWTFIANRAVLRHCASTDSLPYAEVPGAATIRSGAVSPSNTASLYASGRPSTSQWTRACG